MNRNWWELLKSEPYIKKARAIFHKEICEDEKQLRRAAISGKTNIVRQLLSTGILEADCMPSPWTALYLAASCGHSQIVKLLFAADSPAVDLIRED